MALKDIKIGETYLLPVTVIAIEKGGWLETTTCNNYSYRHAPSEVKTLLPNITKNTDPAPKYDPCRKFRKGDKVRAVEYKGRKGTDCPDFTGKIYTVSQEEESNRLLKLTDGVFVYYIDPAYVKLVTPIEELEPYFVGESENSYDLFRKTSGCNQLRASFWWKHNPTPELIELSKANALAAAEAERDRLNAEHLQSTINNQQ